VNYQVRLSAKAERDVEALLQWFAEQSAGAAADRWFERLWTKIATLETMPRRCTVATEAQDVGLELRELLFGRRTDKYRILFTVEDKTVNILHIRRASRDRVEIEDVLP
jgi:plasmid stabilization system protein ParE